MASYEEIQQIPREAALEILAGDNGPERARALLSLAYFDDDWRWVQDKSLTLLEDRDSGMRATAALALAHLARIHRRLELDRVMPALRRVERDPEIAGRVRDALDDIELFTSTGR